MYDAMKAAIDEQLTGIREAGTWKRERIIISPQDAAIRVASGQEVLNFCANNYLGLADHEVLLDAAKAALDSHGLGMASVRFICGTLDLHKELEAALSRFHGKEDTILYAACFDANGGLFEPLLDERDAIVSDALNHASIIDGIRLCKAARFRYAHDDMADLRTKLEEARAGGARRILISTDGVFSMDGDLARVPELLALAERFDAWIVVDDAHGFGVLGEQGRGVLSHFGLRSERLICMGTLGKAAGVGGAFVAAHRTVIDWLVQSARAYIYTTAAPPAMAHTLRASLRIIRGAEGDQRRRHLGELIGALRGGLPAALGALPGETAGAAAAGWHLTESLTAIQPLIVGGSAEALAAAAALESQGLWVPAIRPPTVPAGSARLRITLSAAHRAADVDRLLAALAVAARTTGALA